MRATRPRKKSNTMSKYPSPHYQHHEAGKMEEKPPNKNQYHGQDPSFNDHINDSHIDDNTTENNKSNNYDDDDEDNRILWEWATHTDESFHSFNAWIAWEIKTRLLQWYQLHRRKLPWRGDPFFTDILDVKEGDKGTQVAKRKQKDKDQMTQETKITNYFSATKEGGGGEEECNVLVNNRKRILPENNTMDHDVTSNRMTIIPITGYSVWVSEVMLQQTRVETVIPYYMKWMKSFPTLASLAQATEEDINSHWAGLGYYRRAKLLQSGAQYVLQSFPNGNVPTTVQELTTIPGIGRYTASAIASIAFQKNVPVVDGNVCRVLCRLAGIANHNKATILKDHYGWILANQILRATLPIKQEQEHKDVKPVRKHSAEEYTSSTSTNHEMSHVDAGNLNQALMELGATYCAPIGSTGIDEKDPLVGLYLSTRIGKILGRKILRQQLKNHGCWNAQEFIAEAQSIRQAKSPHQCKLCDPDNGINQVIFQVSKEIQSRYNVSTNGKRQQQPKQKQLVQPYHPHELNNDEIASIIGHNAFPLVSPKKTKREEVLAIAVILYQNSQDEEKWLMVKRSLDGLLANQWEFPSACIWTSAGSIESLQHGTKKRQKKDNRADDEIDDPKDESPIVPFLTADTRQRSIDEMLNTFRVTSDTAFRLDGLTKERYWVGEEPIEHVFSHIRHTMWVELHDLSSSMKQLAGKINQTWTSSDGREVRWMSESDMARVGITSGVKKIITAVKKFRSLSKATSKRRRGKKK